MRSTLVLITCISLIYIPCHGQLNIQFTNPLADEIINGNYDPEDYIPDLIIDQSQEIIDHLLDNVSADQLKENLIEMEQFRTRNTASDTTISGSGIGAARDWAHKKFESYNQENSNRLVVSYLEFSRGICNVIEHRNIVALLPGIGEQKEELIIIEGHFDSRCGESCDIDCVAQGMEDNASGSALVLELARTMSQLTFNRTVMFMLTVGEEQGLHGADAMADYCVDNNVPVRAVYNNDVIGGVLCGETASPPGCPSLNHVDSINVRLYSFGVTNSFHKGLARFTKLQYHENLRDLMEVKPIINIMSAEDRIGRGGDHIPFRQNDFTAIRFTSANEHGDADVHTGYTDRQHTTDDILGIDTNNDSEIDSFFVDFNYLQRNALLNGNAAAMSALGPQTPELTSMEPTYGGFTVTIDDPHDYNHYRVGIRTESNDFDTIYTTNEKVSSITDLDLDSDLYFISVASVDENGIESQFSNELFNLTSSVENINSESKIELLQNRPNPFDDRTSIAVLVKEPITYKTASIEVIKPFGTIIYKTDIELIDGMNEIWYEHQNHHFSPGVLYYRLMIDGKHVQTKSMVYAY